jgi:glycosyltransferase 2 family protein
MTDEPVTPSPPALEGSSVDQAPPSLAARLRQPRTIISIALPLAVLALVVVNLPDFHLDRLAALIGGANPVLLFLALLVYYLGFPLRGYRWGILLKGSGLSISTRDASEIIFLSWLVNCVVPAKLGDVYRAWLLRNNYVVSLSRTFGTVFLERVLDLLAVTVLALASGFWSFRSGLPSAVQVLFGLGVVVVIVLIGGLVTLRNFGRRLIRRLPVPHRLLELYDRFEEGVFGSVGARQVPRLVLLTGIIWATEAGRLWFVIQALGFGQDVQLGISGTFFVALSASLLTAVPFTPAGLGIVEAGVVGILTVIYHVPPTDALSIALVDRSISVLSIIALGGLLYLVSPKVRGAGTARLSGEMAGPGQYQ